MPEETPPQPDMRKQMLSEYRYAPDPLAARTPPPSPGSAPKATPTPSAASDVITMDTYTVRETVGMNALTTSLREEKAAAHTAMMMDKLGVGLHVVRVGKVGLFAGTIFYIPFVVGVGFSW